MEKNYPSYYMPYQDNESEPSDTESETSEKNASGPDFPTFQRQLQYQKSEQQGVYEPLNAPILPTYYINNQTQSQTSLLALRSHDRDITSYPFPVNFSLKPPRIYKDISQIKCVQLIFPNILRGVLGEPMHVNSSITSAISTTKSQTNISTAISLYAGCVDQASATHSFSISENVIINGRNINNLVSIPPQESYNTEGLVSKLNQATNNTPPFNIISFQDFSNNFANTCSITSLFNEPGMYSYNSLCDSYTPNPTKNNIINNYYPNAYTSFISSSGPNTSTTLVAYYYPVLKEAVIHPRDREFIDFSGILTNSSELLSSVVHTFQGYDNNILFNLCSTNQSFLSTYRDKYTFKYNLINQYDWNYDCNKDRISLDVCKLHPSICNDVERQRQYWNSISATPYGALASTNSTIYGKYGTIIPNSFFNISTSLNCSATGPVTLNMNGGGNYHVFQQSSPFLSPDSSCITISNIVSGNYGSLPQSFINTLSLQMGFPMSTIPVYLQTSGGSPPFPRHDLFLQLNTEKAMNRMDVISEAEEKINSPETVINYLQQSTINNSQTLVNVPFSTINYSTSISHGETNAVLGKIMFSDKCCPCKTFSQSFVQNPVFFKPYLGKLDKINFNILLDDGLDPVSDFLPNFVKLENWRGVFQVEEQIPSVKLSHIPNVPLLERKQIT